MITKKMLVFSLLVMSSSVAFAGTPNCTAALNGQSAPMLFDQKESNNATGYTYYNARIQDVSFSVVDTGSILQASVDVQEFADAVSVTDPNAQATFSENALPQLQLRLAQQSVSINCR